MATEEMKTIIYITNNVLDKKIFDKCIGQLEKVANNNRIISVSQKPMVFGDNICVGDIGSSWLNIYKQQLAGLEKSETDIVAIAEHDVLYSPEHFEWNPPRNDVFYYNENNWFLQVGGKHPEYHGMYSKLKKRRALSQLVCGRDLLIKSIKERLFLIDSGLKEMRKLGEPGAFDPKIVKGARLAASGSCAYLRPYLDEHLTRFTSEFFSTDIPNIDIRHGDNFTGPRRGKSRCFSLPYWGSYNKMGDK